MSREADTWRAPGAPVGIDRGTLRGLLALARQRSDDLDTGLAELCGELLADQYPGDSRARDQVIFPRLVAALSLECDDGEAVRHRAANRRARHAFQFFLGQLLILIFPAVRAGAKLELLDILPVV